MTQLATDPGTPHNADRDAATPAAATTTNHHLGSGSLSKGPQRSAVDTDNSTSQDDNFSANLSITVQ